MSQTPFIFSDLEQTSRPSPDSQHEHWSRQQLEHYQARALQICREYAYAHSPFYQQFHRGLTDRPLHELPVLTKSMLLEHFDELVTDRTLRLENIKQYMADPNRTEHLLDRYRVMITSGSSGLPGIFLYDQTEWGSVMASLARLISWLSPAARSKPAIIGTTSSWYMTAYIQKSLQAKGGGSGIRLAVTDPIATTVQRLNEAQPTAILGYPSIIRVLADEQRKGRLHIAPQAAVCASEVLSESVRQLIEDVWHIKPYNLYATTEGGLLGAECEHHRGLHMFEDLVIVEPVDHDNQPVPPGVTGNKVLLTVLFGRTMPLIRYELTDCVGFSTSGSCPCGRPFTLIDDPQGRTWGEALYFPTPSGAEIALHPILFESVTDMFPISGWQIVQELDGLHILVSGAEAKNLDEDLLKAMRQTLEEQDVIIPPLFIEHVTTIPRGSSGKTTLVVSHIARTTA